MFEYLEIENFQSHRKTRIDFDPGLNVIIGTSQNGKTAIARALGLLINNRPLGCKYYSNFAENNGSTKIALKTVDTPVIELEKTVRIKKDGAKELVSTSYSFNDQTSSDLSDEIKASLNISELNLQKQFDQPFLILSSAGEFARVINRITRMEKVDSWVSTLKKRINKEKDGIEFLESQIKESEKELVKYSGFEDFKAEILKLKNLCESLQKIEQDFTNIDSQLEKIERIDDELQKIIPAISLEKEIEALAEYDLAIDSLSKEFSLIEKAKEIDITISDLQFIATNLEDLISISKIEEEFNLIDSRLEKIEKLEDEIKELESLCSSISVLIDIMEVEEKFNKINFNLKKIEEINNFVKTQNILYNNINEQLIEELKNTTECPIFLSSCLCHEQMLKRVEK